jgi:hypothetical protein
MTAQTAVQKLIDPFADGLKYIRELKEMYEMSRVLRDMERVCALHWGWAGHEISS